MYQLIDRKILDIDVDKENNKVKFTTDKGIIIYQVSADYGREGWIESIEDIHNLFNQEVSKVTGDSYEVSLWTQKGISSFSCRGEWGYEASFSCVFDETDIDNGW